MRTTITKTVMAAFLSAMALLFAVGCGEKEPPVISVSSVSLSKTSITIKEGSSESLSATVSPSDAQNKAVSPLTPRTRPSAGRLRTAPWPPLTTAAA